MVPERSSRARANPARGIALIATAVIVGIFLLRNGWEESGSVSAASGDGASADGAPGDSEDATETTATTQPPRPPGEVTVRVLNASGVSGAAAERSDQLAQEGYQMVEAGNAPEGTDPSTTVVLFAAGYDQEAALVAQALGAAPTSIATFSDPPQADPAGAQVVVLLGADHAG